MTGHGEDLDAIVEDEVGDQPKPLPPSLSSQLRQSDPFVTGMALLLTLVVAGFVLIGLGKRSLARQLNVAYQLPGLISGCIGGLTILAVGVGLAVVLHGRRVEAGLRAETDDAVAAATALVTAAKARKAARTARAATVVDAPTETLPAVSAPRPRRPRAATPAPVRRRSAS